MSNKTYYLLNTCNLAELPSGKRLHNYGKSTHFSWEIPLYFNGHVQ